MTWVKLDDRFHFDSDVVRLSDAAYRLYVGGLCYCNWQETDGWIDGNRLLMIGQAMSRSRRLGAASELLNAGLWLAEGGGFRIKNYLEYQPSRAQLDERRERLREMGKRGGVASGLKRHASSAALQPDASTGPVEARPVPSRPVEITPLVPPTPQSYPQPPVDNGAKALTERPTTVTFPDRGTLRGGEVSAITELLPRVKQ